MADQATGRITYANGMPAAGIDVRMFDRDIGGIDDDLTLNAGTSDADGRFTLSYDASRAADKLTLTVNTPRSLIDWTPVAHTTSIADPLDIFMPYLQLRYRLYGVDRIQTVSYESSPQEIRLADPPPRAGTFIPSQHGFHFLNSFPGTPLPFTIPALPGLTEIPSYYGLCGGMSAAAADYFYASRATPSVRTVPSKRTALYQYLLKRQMDSFSPLGEPVLRFMKWMKLDEQSALGTWHRTSDEFLNLKAMFDAGVPVHPIGLVFANPGDPLWENHQVLACGYTERSPTQIEIKIYDPNFPESDQVVIRAERGQITNVAGGGVTTLRCARVARVADAHGQPVEEIRPMRGMFLMPYEPIMPPPGL